MISIICSTQYPLDGFKEEIIKSSGLKDKVEFLEYINNDEFSLTEIYNRGLKESKYDICVFLHNDIIMNSSSWAGKLLKHFERNPDYGIIGVAGTKYMAPSGMWWEDTRKMYGRVGHMHEGKTWISKYSDDLGSSVEEVLVVDGVFFAVHKNRIKKNFDESFKGFHFYDVDFSFSNYLAGVKVGVITNIQLTHKSIGMTNEKWDKNKAQFVDKFNDELPKSIKRVLRKNEKLKVILAVPSENTDNDYYLSLIKAYKNELSFTAYGQLSTELRNVCNKNGIKIYDIKEPPNFKMGDGQWVLNTANGPITSVVNTLYKVNDMRYDIIHMSDELLKEHVNKLYPTTPIISGKLPIEVIKDEYCEVIE
jgi:hypothetical protein